MNLRWLILCCLISAVASLRAEAVELTAPAVALSSQVDQAGAVGQVSLTITVDRELLPGARIIVTSHRLDTRRFAGADVLDQISFTISNPLATLLPSLTPVPQMTGQLRSLQDALVLEVRDGVVNQGDQISIQLDDFRLPEAALGAYQLPVYLQTDPTQAPVRLTSTSVPVNALRGSRLVASADPMVAPDQEVTLSIRLEDEFGNLAQPRPLSLDLLVNGRFRNRIEMSGNVHEVGGIQFSTPGVYQLELRTGGGSLRATANPVWVREYASSVVWLSLGEATAGTGGWKSADEAIESGRGLYDLIVPLSAVEESQVRFSDEPLMIRRQQTGSGGYGELRFGRGAPLAIAMPEQATDLRRLMPDSFKAVAVMAGHSVYPWILNRAADQGYSPAVVAVIDSNQYPQPRAGYQHRTFTGLLVRQGQRIDEALSSGQSFVAQRERIVIDVAGSRSLKAAAQQQFEVSVLSESPIIRVDMFRNGQLDSSRTGSAAILNQADETAAEASISDTLRFWMSLSSSSEPLGGLSSQPRNGREWVGFVATQDSGLSVEDDANWRLFQHSNGRRLDFLAHTHGESDRLALTLDSPTADTVLEIGLAPGFEDAAWLPADRLPAELPGQRFLISISELEDGTVRSFEVDGYRDEIRFEPRRPALPSPATVTFNDPRASKLGDYYYFRVVTEGGGVAYSSVFMVDTVAENGLSEAFRTVGITAN